MFDNLKCVTRSIGATGTYIADRLEHANIEANADDSLQIAKKVNALQQEGGLAVQLFNSFQSGKRFTLTVEDTEEETTNG